MMLTSKLFGRSLIVRGGSCVPREVLQSSTASFSSTSPASIEQLVHHSPPFDASQFRTSPRKFRKVTKATFALRGVIAVAVFGVGIGVYMKSINTFPPECMSLLEQANKQLIQAQETDPQSSSLIRTRLLESAEQCLKSALSEINQLDPTVKDPEPPSFLHSIQLVDPELAPYVLLQLGRVCTEQGTKRYQDAEKYYLEALRLMLEPEDYKSQQSSTTDSASSSSSTLSDLHYTPAVLITARELGWLYHLMHNDLAAEVVLFRCLHIAHTMKERELQEKSDLIKKSPSPSASSMKFKLPLSPIPGDSRSLFGDDVASEICEQLSTVFRSLGDHEKAVEWAHSALRLNDRATTTTQDDPQSQTTEMKQTRLIRALHLYTGLSADHFAANQLKRPPTHSIKRDQPTHLDNAYHAAVHALETWEQLVNLQQLNKNNLQSSSPSSASASSLSSRSPSSSAPPMKSAPLNLLSPTAHVRYLSSPYLDRVYTSNRSAEGKALLVETTAVYSNIATILAAQGKKKDGEQMWKIAEKTAKLTGEPQYQQLVQQQRQKETTLTK